MKNLCIAIIFFLSFSLKAQVNFGISGLIGSSIYAPTSIQFGLDGKLYVSQANGEIHVYSILRNGPNDYEVSNTEIITKINEIPNHNDDGTLNTAIENRLITGILVKGTASNPIIYVSSSDPRSNEQDTTQLGIKSNLDTNSGMVSKLFKVGNGWERIDLVRGLPRSEEVHASNGMQLDESSNILYLAQGGHTNMGAPSFLFSYTPEYALSSAILSIDLNMIGNTTFDLLTLNDEDRPDVLNASYGMEDVNDPFGGNQGKNMAMLKYGSPVQIHASGFRNAYDLLLASNGKLYTIDNGPNGGYGGWPTNCLNDTVEGGSSSNRDGLFLIEGNMFYGGHANPTRGNYNNIFNSSNPQHPVDSIYINPNECVYEHFPDVIFDFVGSTNGFCEYTASNFNNAMKGDLIAAYLDGDLYRISLNVQGDSLDSIGVSILASNFGGDPLDVCAQGDSTVYPGTIWAACYGTDAIVVLEPADYSGPSIPCNPISPNADSDGDCFSNFDENLNGTNLCNSAAMPGDYDEDCISNLLDNDDDNDGIIDEMDAYALDYDNGNNTFIPILLNFDNTDHGGVEGWGFTGLMINEQDNYEDLYNKANMTVGAAAQRFTIDSVPNGAAYSFQNDLAYAFQLGINSNQATDDFTVRTRLSVPFAAISPQNEQSQGLFIGDGTQHNYLKFVVHAVDGLGGFKFLFEENDTFPGSSVPLEFLFVEPLVLEATFIDLFLNIEKNTGLVQCSYATDGGNRINLFDKIEVPHAWLDSVLAVGFIASSRNAFPFTASWDDLEIYYEKLTSITDGKNILEVDVHPNPAKANVVISATNVLKGSLMQVCIYDMTGTIVCQKEVLVTKRMVNQKIDLSKLPSGTYIINVYNEDKFFCDKLMISSR